MTTHEFSVHPVHHFGADGTSPDSFQYHHSAPASSSHTPDSSQRGVMQQAFGPPGGEVKPRLTKEQTDILETNFRVNPKPNTQTKREFANDLKVPLDKVNNWFQNRRAKVKQDLKKAQGMGIAAFAQVPVADGGQLTHEQYKQYATLFASQPFISQDPADAHPQMFPHGMPPSAVPDGQIPVDQNMVLSSNDIPPDFVMPGFDTHMENAHTGPTFAFSQADQYHLPAHAMMGEPSHVDGPASYAPNMNAFVGPDYNMQLSGPRTEPIDPAAYQPPTASNQTMHTFPAIDTDAVQDPFRSSSESSAVDSAFMGWQGEKHHSISASPHDQNQNHFEFQHGPSRHGRIVSQPNDQFRLFTSINHGDSPNETSDPFAGNRMVHQRTFSSPVISVSAAPDPEPQFSTEQPLAFPDESFARRTSSTAELADSMGNVEIDSEQHEDDFRKPNGPSSLAMRRRQRPVALGDPAALRSASYCGPMTSSPNQNLAPDSHLRRIKSTAGLANGVSSGRIQKPGSSQRSPINFTFAEAGSSPKFSAQMGEYCGNPPSAAPPSSASAAPPTPLTPQDAAPRFPPWQAQRAATYHPQMHGHHSSFGDIGEFSPQLASPPTTPMYGNQIARARLGQAFVPEDTPPQSAPATQQCFPRPPVVHGTSSSPDAMALYAFPDMPNMTNTVHRRPSLPEANPFSDMDTPVPFPVPMPMVNQDGQLRLDYPLQWAQGVPDHTQMHDLHLQHQTFMGRHPSNSSSSSAPVPPKPMGELNVSMWQPPNPVAPADQQPKGQDNQAKNFTFQNTGPENYEKLSSASS
ncbi:MAG: hypothetical protein M1822_007946 [Bathelium mastoideum]|nr:MAG: hypothetical protein M1822_007946 [Bathelium mastoideum]